MTANRAASLMSRSDLGLRVRTFTFLEVFIVWPLAFVV